MERHAAETDLFALYDPQIGLVLEMADYDPADVQADDFDATYWQWLQTTFEQDAIPEPDCMHIQRLWNEARLAATVTTGQGAR
ncbi:hypothetical protein [Halomonas sp. WWR20]